MPVFIVLGRIDEMSSFTTCLNFPIVSWLSNPSGNYFSKDLNQSMVLDIKKSYLLFNKNVNRSQISFLIFIPGWFI